MTDRNQATIDMAQHYSETTSAAPDRIPYKPVVYVIQDDTRRNFTSALDFGSLEPVLQADEEANMLNMPSITAKIKRALQRMTPHDYLLLSGSPVSIGVAFMVAGELTGGRFKVLKWDNQERRYFALPVDVQA